MADAVDIATKNELLHLTATIEAARGIEQVKTSGTCTTCLTPADNLINNTCVPCRQLEEDKNMRLYGNPTGPRL